MKREEVQDGQSVLPILVGVDSASSRVYADVLPSKGTQHEYSVVRAFGQVEATGHPKIIYKSDDDGALMALAGDNGAERPPPARAGGVVTEA